MKVQIDFTLFHKHRTLLGAQLVKNGAMRKDDEGNVYLQHTYQLTFGIVFAFMDITFDVGEQVPMIEINQKLRELAMETRNKEAHK